MRWSISRECRWAIRRADACTSTLLQVSPRHGVSYSMSNDVDFAVCSRSYMGKAKGIHSSTTQSLVDGSILSRGNGIFAVELRVCLWSNIEMCLLECIPIVQSVRRYCFDTIKFKFEVSHKIALNSVALSGPGIDREQVKSTREGV